MFENYAEYEYLLAAWQLVFAMLGMGALLTPRDFATVIRSPRALLLGLLTQLLTVPLLAAALGGVLPIPAGVAAGLVLVAAVPGGTMSNIFTYLGRGNIALSIALTGITTVGALVTTPTILRLFVGAHLPADFEMPVGRVASEIGLTLLAPLAAGMAFGARFPYWREVFSRWSIRASFFMIGLIVIGAAGSDRLDPREYGPLAPVAIALLAFGAQAAALLTSRAGALVSSDRLALAVEVTIRNTNLAILVKALLFPASAQKDPIGDGMLFVALLYGGVALLLALPAVLLHRRSAAPG